MKKKKVYYKPKGKKTTKTTTAKKKSYYKPKKKVVKEPAVTKKYKSYYKPKKKVVAVPVITNTIDQIIDLFGGESKVVSVPEVVKSKRPVKYLNNKDLLAQVVLSKKNDKMTNELAKMLQLLTMRYGKKGNFSGYTYNDDMQSYAMLMIVKTWRGFDPAKSSNPFAWFTQCIKNSFIQFLNSEKRQRDIRDEILVDSGMNPSFNYQYEYAAEDKGGEVPENENVELPAKPSHNDVTFEAPEEDDVPVEVQQY